MKVLVTGATGLVGSHLVRALLQRGDHVRALARNADRAAPLRVAGADVRLGDLGAPASLQGVADGMDAVFHLGSVMRGSVADFERVDVQGTVRVLAEAQRAGVARFVYASTLAGYPTAAAPAGQIIDERTPLDATGRLGNYARAKARCEELVLQGSVAGGTECLVVRLGLVCGAGASLFPPHVCKALTSSRVILFGDGSVRLPLVLIDNAVQALILAATMPGIAGETFNIVDEDALTQLEYLELLRKCHGGRPRVVRLPSAAYYALGLVSEVSAGARGKEAETTRYRIRSRRASVRWDCTKAKTRLGWQAPVPLRKGLEAAFRQGQSVPAQGGG